MAADAGKLFSFSVTKIVQASLLHRFEGEHSECICTYIETRGHFKNSTDLWNSLNERDKFYRAPSFVLCPFNACPRRLVSISFKFIPYVCEYTLQVVTRSGGIYYWIIKNVRFGSLRGVTERW